MKILVIITLFITFLFPIHIFAAANITTATNNYIEAATAMEQTFQNHQYYIRKIDSIFQQKKYSKEKLLWLQDIIKARPYTPWMPKLTSRQQIILNYIYAYIDVELLKITADKKLLQSIDSYAYYQWNTHAPIAWIEFSDVNCQYCQKLAKSKVNQSILEQFPSYVKHSYFGFIGVGGASTQAAMETIECVGMTAGDEAYSYTFRKSLTEWKNDNKSLLSYAAEAGVDKAAVEACVANGDSKDQIEAKFNIGLKGFDVSGTPSNILINTLTGEYEMIPGAYPEASFVEAVNRLLGN